MIALLIIGSVFAYIALGVLTVIIGNAFGLAMCEEEITWLPLLLWPIFVGGFAIAGLGWFPWLGYKRLVKLADKLDNGYIARRAARRGEAENVS